MRQRKMRRGAIVPLSALLMVFLLGMVAFVVDVGWIAVVKSDLQNAADAAALAGANMLPDYFVTYKIPGQSASNKAVALSAAQTAARAKAKEYSQYNSAGGVNSLKLLDSDIEFGFTDASNKYTPLPTYTGFPNTIKVTIRRDSNANGALGLFFGRVLGLSSTSLSASAAATLYTGSINNFASSNTNTALMPFTYDVNHWNNFMSTGKGPDDIALTDFQGNPQLVIYPSVKFPGNFGQLSLDDSHVGESIESGWVKNGVSPSEMQILRDHSLIPLSNHPDGWDWCGDTGLKSSLVTDMNLEAGKTFYLPLFKPKNSSLLTYQAGVGQGSGYDYNIVAFVPVRVVDSRPINNVIRVEPVAIIEGEVTYNQSSIVPAGTTSMLVTTFATPRLSQ